MPDDEPTRRAGKDWRLLHALTEGDKLTARAAKLEQENEQLHQRMGYWRERATILEQGITEAKQDFFIAGTPAAEVLQSILNDAQEADEQWTKEFSTSAD